MRLSAEDLVGARSLEQFVISHSDGRPPLLPFGADARGLLLYSADGRMSAILCRGERAPLGIATLEQAERASKEAKAEAFSSYVSYAGRYRVEREPGGADRVVHEVELSLLPDLVGAEQARRAFLKGDQLALSYEVTPRSGVVRLYLLTWRRSLACA